MKDKIVKSVVIPAFFKDSIHNEISFKEKINIICEQGFYEGIEFYFNGDKNQRNEVRKCLVESNLYSVFLAGNPMKVNNIDLGDLNEAKRSDSIVFVKNLIDQAYFYGSKKMLIVSGKAHNSKEDSEKAFLNLVESIKDLCSYSINKAKDYTLDISLEYFNDKGEPFFLIGPYSLALELVKAIHGEYKNFELTFDLSHSLQLREDPVNALTQINKHVTHIHLANCVINDDSNVFFGDKHPPFNISEGELYEEDLIRFISQIKDLGCFSQNKEEIVIGLEVITPGDSNEKDLFHNMTNIFKKVINEL